MNKQLRPSTLTEVMRQYGNILNESSAAERDESGRLSNPNISYEVSTSKVIAQLKSYNSQSYTKLAQKLQRVDELDREAKQLKAEIKQDTRDLVADLFSAEDTVRTRVVETISFIFTLSKDPKPTETVKYADVIKELEQHLTPELITILEDLKEKYKSVTQKAPSLKLEPNEKIDESVYDTVLEKLKPYFAKFKSWIERWGKKYDNKLNRLKTMAGVA